MFDRTALKTLSTVLGTGSFEAAADQLGVSQPAVTARIKTLEEQTGAILLRRTRPVQATEAGRRLQAHAETLNLMEHAVSHALGLRPDMLDRPLRIAVTADTLATWILPALPRDAWMFYDLVIDDQDHTNALLANGEVAAAISSQSYPPSGCVTEPLGKLRYAAFCAPAFAEKYFPEGATAAEMLVAPALTFNRKDQLQRVFLGHLVGHEIRVLNTHYLPSTHGITEAARAGLGWATNPIELVQPLFDSGELIHLHPDIALETPLFWHVPRQNAPLLAELSEALRKAATARGST